MLDEEHGDAAPVADGADLVRRAHRPPRGSSRRPARRAAGASARSRAPGRARRACARRTAIRRPDGPRRPRGRTPRSARPPAPRPAAPRARRTEAPSALARKPPRASACAPTRTLSRVVMVANSATFWNVRAMPSAAISWRAKLASGRPSNRIVPECGIVEAGDAVEQRGLAGAVRPDQAADRAAGDVEADVLQRGHAAEADRDAVDREQRRAPAARRLRSWLSPRPAPWTFRSLRSVLQTDSGRQHRRFRQLVTCFCGRIRHGRRSRKASTPAL